MNKGIFMTGTGTGVGKTFVSTGLIMAMKERGLDVCPVKPVESGCRISKGEAVPADALGLLRASGVKETLNTINPYRLRHPLAPSVAAEMEGVVISRKKILSACCRLLNSYDVVIIEGAGGIMTPVYKRYLFLDLAADLGLPVVVVSAAGLGTINHTLLTIEAARGRGLEVAAVVINHAVKSRKGPAERTNPGVIARLARVDVAGIVPHSANPGTPRMMKIFGGIADRILSRL
ncbi:MAG: dethiobiotin synthase [Deferribacteres bacterium]|nr:dethiobiotin synthase [Deferribacteres bacterium]